jgi:hypothetical protein
MIRACHKGIILNGVGKHDKLRASLTAGFRRQFCGVFYYPAHERDSFHIDAGLCCRYIDAGANMLGRVERGRDRVYKPLVALGKTFMDKRGEPADKVDACLAGRVIERYGKRRIVYRVTCGGNYRDGRNGYSLVHYGYAEFEFDILSGSDKLFSAAGDFVVDFSAGYLDIAMGAIQQ